MHPSRARYASFHLTAQEISKVYSKIASLCCICPQNSVSVRSITPVFFLVIILGDVFFGFVCLGDSVSCIFLSAALHVQCRRIWSNLLFGKSVIDFSDVQLCAISLTEMIFGRLSVVEDFCRFREFDFLDCPKNTHSPQREPGAGFAQRLPTDRLPILPDVYASLPKFKEVPR